MNVCSAVNVWTQMLTFEVHMLMFDVNVWPDGNVIVLLLLSTSRSFGTFAAMNWSGHSDHLERRQQ